MLEELLKEIGACRVCEAHLEPRPVVQAGRGARILIAGQAPGARVHASGVPWDDPSGVRLREWTGLDPETFYDPERVALIPTGFCYPGKGRSGDLPPRPECAPLWHARLRAELPEIRLTLLVGAYAQRWWLRGRAKATLTATVEAWREYEGEVPLPHPSPRNRPWVMRRPWFEAELVPELRRLAALALQ